MIQSRVIHFISLLLLALIALTVSAQSETTPEPEATPEATTTCPEIVEEALRITGEECSGAGRNEICYGHELLDAELRSGLPQNSFDQRGERVDVLDIEQMSLSALDTIAGVWGVVLMRIQADLDLELDDNVTFVVFGDAALEAASQLVRTETIEDINVRAAPSVSSSILTSLDNGENIVASGRTEDNAWLRIRLVETSREGGSSIGWVSAPLTTIEEEDLERLPVVSPSGTDAEENSPVNFGPMQAFYFQSARDDAPCAEAPNSGMLIQTPEGQASVSIWIDEIIVELNATAFVQAQPDGEWRVNVLDGFAEVTSNGESHTAIAGTQISVPLDEELGAAGAPDAPVPFDEEDMQSLEGPLGLLPSEVEIPVSGGVPAPGTWQFTWDVNEMTCPDSTVVPFVSDPSASSTITLQENGDTVIWSGNPYTRSATGVYSRSYVDARGNVHQVTLNVVSRDGNRITGVDTIDYADIACTLEVPFSMQLISN